MNFKDLLEKMQAIEEATPPLAPTKDDKPEQGGAGAGDESAEEGIISLPMPMPMGAMAPQKEQDHVTMNVSLNGNGAGGVRDLMNILRQIDHGQATGGAHEPAVHHEPMHHEPEHHHGDDVLFGDGYENSVHGDTGPVKYGVDAVTQSGNDMLSNQGDHRMRQTGLPVARPTNEALVNRLQAMYEQIKSN